MTESGVQRPPRMAPVAVAALCLAAALAACGETRGNASSTDTTGPRPAQPAAGGGAPGAAVTVSEGEFALTPARAAVTKAGMVTIAARNAGRVPHALAVHGSGGVARTAAIAPGRSARLTVRLGRPGAYEWYCPLDGHRARGMRGTIVVAGG